MRNLNNVRNSKTVTDISDISLIAQVTVFHNKQAFNRLVVKYQSPVRRFFLNQTMGDEQLSDDLAQETFIKAYVNLQKFRGLANFSTWLFRIAYNVYYDYLRNSKPTVDIDAPRGADDKGGSREGEVSSRCGRADNRDPGLRMDLYDALRRLNPAERTCITLQLLDGYSIDKIADITGLAQGTVKSHLSRGKVKLATYLKKNGYDGK